MDFQTTYKLTKEVSFSLREVSPYTHSMSELRITNSLKLTMALANVGLGRKGMEALIVAIVME